MKLVSKTGCICSSLTVDGIEEIDLTDEARKEALEKIGEYIKTLPRDRTYEARRLLTWFTEMTDEEVEECSFTLRDIGEMVKTTNPGNLNYILQGFVDRFYTEKPDISEPCSCCGDSIWTFTVDIP